MLRRSDNLPAMTHAKHVKEGLCTSSMEIEAGVEGWPKAEIDIIKIARISGKSKKKIRKIVFKLEAERPDFYEIFSITSSRLE